MVEVSVGVVIVISHVVTLPPALSITSVFVTFAGVTVLTRRQGRGWLWRRRSSSLTKNVFPTSWTD
jgi:hypothetical protein